MSHLIKIEDKWIDPRQVLSVYVRRFYVDEDDEYQYRVHVSSQKATLISTSFVENREMAQLEADDIAKRINVACAELTQ